MATKTLKRKPKHFWGAAISAATKVATSVANGFIEKKRLEEEGELQRTNANRAIDRTATNDRNIYQEYIANHPEMVYGTNKEIQAFGKDDPMKTIAEGIQTVEAGTHESGNDVERKEDFVEGGETLVGEAVHSNRIEAYSPAQMSASLGAVLDEITRVSKRATGAVKGDLSRLGVKVTQKIDEVTAKQEAIKEDYGSELDAVNGGGVKQTAAYGSDSKPKNAFGIDELRDKFRIGTPKQEDNTVIPYAQGDNGFRFYDDPGVKQVDTQATDIPDVGGQDLSQLGGAAVDLGASLIDNVVNAALLKKTPRVNRPNFYKAQPMETEVDVTENLSAISDQQDKLDSFIDASTASGNTAIQRKRASADRGIKAENQVYHQKNKEEMMLRNRKHLNEQRIDNMNTNLLNNYDDKVTQRESDILSAKSQNVSNLSRDFTSTIDKYRMGEFQDEQLKNDASKYQDSGVIATTALNGAYDHVSNEDKMQIIKTVENAGRPADVIALKQRWGL